MKQTILYTVAVYLLLAVIVVSCSPIEIDNTTDPLDPDKGRLIVWTRTDAGFGKVDVSLDKGGTIDQYSINYGLDLGPDCQGTMVYQADIKENSHNNKIYILTATAENGLTWRKEIKFTDGYCDHMELYTDNAEIQSLTCGSSLTGVWKRMNNAGTSDMVDMQLEFINDTAYVIYSKSTEYPTGSKKMCGYKSSDCTIQDYVSGYGFTTRIIKFINIDNIMINNQILYKRLY